MSSESFILNFQKDISVGWTIRVESQHHFHSCQKFNMAPHWLGLLSDLIYFVQTSDGYYSLLTTNFILEWYHSVICSFCVTSEQIVPCRDTIDTSWLLLLLLAKSYSSLLFVTLLLQFVVTFACWVCSVHFHIITPPRLQKGIGLKRKSWWQVCWLSCRGQSCSTQPSLLERANNSSRPTCLCRNG